MEEKQYSRRVCLRAAAAGGLSALAVAGTRPAQAALNRLPEVKIAGYAYDRVPAIQDGRLGLDGFDVDFHAEDIYSLNKQLFGPKRTYEVSETGLIPYVTRYANEARVGRRLIAIGQGNFPVATDPEPRGRRLSCYP